MGESALNPAPCARLEAGSLPRQVLGVTPHYGQEQTHPDSQAPSRDCALISAAWGPRGIEDGGHPNYDAGSFWSDKREFSSRLSG